MTETCALDIADRGGTTLEEVGAIMNLTRERIRQVEVKGLAKLAALRDMTALRDYVDEGPTGRRRLPVIAVKSEEEEAEDAEEADDDSDSGSGGRWRNVGGRAPLGDPRVRTRRTGRAGYRVTLARIDPQGRLLLAGQRYGGSSCADLRLRQVRPISFRAREALAARGVGILSSGGTARALTARGDRRRDRRELHGVAGGDGRSRENAASAGPRRDPLARGEKDKGDLERLGAREIDLVVVNLYPFERVAADPKSPRTSMSSKTSTSGDRRWSVRRRRTMRA